MALYFDNLRTERYLNIRYIHSTIQTKEVCSIGVHNIHITVDDEEYKMLMVAKGNKTWHDFLLESCQDE